MILEKFTKQPIEVKDYDIDYAPWLAESMDSIESVATDVICITDPSNTTLQVDKVQFTVSRAKLWISGGTNGNKYKVQVTTATVGERIDQSELIFTVKEV